MKVIIDDKIPYIRESAEKMFSEVVYLPGSAISATDVKDADAMIVRTRTCCNKYLLEGSSVKFIATATIGYDHIDTQYLKDKGIEWTNCPGCNATSVGQYIESCLLLLQRHGLLKENPTVGIVGVGHVGTQVAKKLEKWGCPLLFNDPPKAESYKSVSYCSLQELAEKCDVITFHTPLTRSGDYPTWHLGDKKFFGQLQKNPIIINAARGGVVDEKALLEAYNVQQVRAYVLDTWENEPNISPTMLEKAFIATPHIAGYSADGKSNASRMALTAVCQYFGIKPEFSILPPSLPSSMKPASTEEERKLQLYNPLTDSNALKQHPEQFEYLRGNYPLRRESWS